MAFERVLVVGAGQMGGGIAQVVAASGRRVSLHDSAPGAVERGLAAMRSSAEKLAAKGGPDAEDVLGRVEAAETLVAADLMIEAVVEDQAVKERSSAPRTRRCRRRRCSRPTRRRSRSRRSPPSRN